MNSTIERIDSVRRAMDAQGLSALIVPTEDPHQSEYPADHFRLREYLSGFTGSAGTLVVTADHAALWTDSRYYLAASDQLSGSGIELQRDGQPSTPDIASWLGSVLEPEGRVGHDPRLASIQRWRSLSRQLELEHLHLTEDTGLCDIAWRTRPPLPTAPIWELPHKNAGEGSEAKLSRVRAKMKRYGARAHVIASLDDIAWLLNLRGSDVAHNPVFLAYLLVSDSTVEVFLDHTRLTDAARSALERIGADIRPYEGIIDACSGAPQPVLVDPERISHALSTAIGRSGSADSMIEARQPTVDFKAQKTEHEIRLTRRTMVADGAAMVRFLHWLETTLQSGGRPTEIDASNRLRAFRAENEGFIGESFSPISGWAAHGAIVHYSAEPDTTTKIGPRGLYLIDSGGQYQTGTTDITRTIAVGAPTSTEREDATLVLKGHIALARLKFPAGTHGQHIDAIARHALWMAGRTYGHGTGHGVGYVLNVHEGPHWIKPREGDTELKPGMIVSNEPGLYREGSYGIRIENLLHVVEDSDGPFGSFLAFETLSWCPYDRALIEKSLLTEDELSWINDYHRTVRDTLADLLDADTRAWLEQACAPL